MSSISFPSTPYSEWSPEVLEAKSKEIQENWNYTNIFLKPKDYKTDFSALRKAKGIAATVAAIAGIYLFVIGYPLLVSGHLLSLPQNFLNAVQHINYIHLAIAGGVVTVTLIAVAVILHRAHSSTEELLKISPEAAAPKRGAIRHIDKHLTHGVLRLKKWNDQGLPCYVDTSTLDANGHGKAYAYSVKPLGNHYQVSGLIMLGMPPFLIVGSMIKNLVYAFFIPVYIVVQCCREAYKGEAIYPKEGKFELLDAPKAFFVSLWRVVKAPFYGIAFFFTAVYSLFNPMGGRKIGAAVERDWDDGANIAEAFWFYGDHKQQPLWKRDGAWGPKGLNRKRNKIAGCWQPCAMYENIDGVVRVYWMAKAVDKDFGEDYGFYTNDDIDKDTIGPDLRTKRLAIEHELARRKNPPARA